MNPEGRQRGVMDFDRQDAILISNCKMDRSRSLMYFISELRTPLSIPLIQTNMTLPNSLQLAQKEGRIALAVQAYKEGRISSLYTAAQSYDIPESILRGCIKGIIM